jgi:transglutaminase-like putative cysteine protease
MSSPLRLTIISALATATTALSLASVFTGAGWFAPVMIAIVLVSGVSALVRWSPLPSAFEPLLAAVAVLFWLTLLDAHGSAHIGFVPGRTALEHLGRIAHHGFADVRKLPTPVPTHRGLILLAVVGVAATALVVDLLAVTLRRAALAGLPLLALFTICAATAHRGVSLGAFVVAAIGYTMLLYFDNRERVSRWGAALGAGSRARPASAWSLDPSAPPAPGMLGRRVGAAAIGAAVVVPLVIPGLHGGIGHHGGDGSGAGGGNVSTFNPIVGVGQDLTSTVNHEVLTYRTTAKVPGYLRLTSLDTYNNGTFSSGPLQQPQSANVNNGMTVVAPSATRVTTQVHVLAGYEFRWLPVPQTALSVRVPGTWLYDPDTATIFSASTTTSDASYSVVSSPDHPTPTALSAATSAVGQFASDLAHPQISRQVMTLTHRITAGAKSKYDAALDIQNYLTSGRFTYTTSVPPDSSSHALTDFLLRSRRGFCQQFATAMAVMARLSGIPSRVAVGFTPGVQQPDGSYIVSTHDAHAWPELWFPGFGWLPFEPTPRDDNQTVTPSYARAAPNQHDGQLPQQPVAKPGSKPGGNGKPHRFHDGSGSSPTATHHHSALSKGLAALSIAAIVIAGIVLLALVTPGVTRIAVRRRRWSAVAAGREAIPAAWAELRDSAVDAGAPWDDGASPRGAIRSLHRWLADVRTGQPGSTAPLEEALRRLASAEERDRYAPQRPDAGRTLRHDVDTVRSALRRSQPATARVWAVVLPRSTRLRIQRSTNRGFDVAGGIVQWLEALPGIVVRRARTARAS